MAQAAPTYTTDGIALSLDGGWELSSRCRTGPRKYLHHAVGISRQTGQYFTECAYCDQRLYRVPWDRLNMFDNDNADSYSLEPYVIHEETTPW